MVILEKKTVESKKFMHILFVTAYVPSPIRVRSYNFIKALVQRGHRVTLVCAATVGDGAALAEMDHICDRVVAVEMNKARMTWNTLCALPGDLPMQAATSAGRPLAHAVRQAVYTGRYDVAHVEHVRAAAMSSTLHSLPRVLDAVDSISLLFERTLRGSASLKSRLIALIDLARTRRYEASYFAHYNQVLVSSPEDAWALQELACLINKRHDVQHVHVVPNGVDLTYFAPQHVERLANTLIFSGKMSYHANVAAVLLLVRDIMPLVWAEQPDVQVQIVGSAPPRIVRALARDQRISVTGYVADVRPFIARSTLAVCSLRYGVGIQNKVLEAMAMQTPVIAACQVAQALHVQHDCELLLAQTAAQYAQFILELLADAVRRDRLGQAGRQYVAAHHRWDHAAARLEEIYTHSR